MWLQQTEHCSHILYNVNYPGPNGRRWRRPAQHSGMHQCVCLRRMCVFLTLAQRTRKHTNTHSHNFTIPLVTHIVTIEHTHSRTVTHNQFINTAQWDRNDDDGDNDSDVRRRTLAISCRPFPCLFITNELVSATHSATTACTSWTHRRTGQARKSRTHCALRRTYHTQ